MKHLSILIAVLVVFLASCSTQDDCLTVEDNNPFMRLVEQDIYPANQLSEDAVQTFNASLLIEDGEILSGNFTAIQNELSEEDFQLLFNLIFGQEVLFVEDKIKINENEMIEKAGCMINILYHHQYRANIDECVSKRNYFCRVCIPWPID